MSERPARGRRDAGDDELTAARQHGSPTRPRELPGRAERDRRRRGRRRDACRCCCWRSSQILLAGAQLGASSDVVPARNFEPDVGADPDLDALRTGLAELLDGVDDTPRCSTPTWTPSSTRFRLSDDLADVAADLVHGLQHYRGRPAAGGAVVVAVLLPNHWGAEASAALRALQAVVAHAGSTCDEEVSAAAERRARRDADGPPGPCRQETRSELPDPGRYTRAASAASREERRAVALVVQKYGGSSVADAERHQAGRPAHRRRPARPATTSSSSSPRWATPPTSCSTSPSRSARCRPARELDMLLTAGERISMALLAMAIANLGYEARSFTGSQAGVITDAVARQGADHRRHAGPHRERARRGRDRDRRRLPGRLPGHQGHHHARPRRLRHHRRRARRRARRRRLRDLHRRRRRLHRRPADRARRPGRSPQISYEEMLELAACGAKVLHLRCVEYARRFDMPIHVRSSFSPAGGHLGHRQPQDRRRRRGAADHLRRRARPQRGQDHRRRRARQARRGRADLRGASPTPRSTST